jgi:predicted Zn finger-like uncharacterized protein
MILVCPSCDTRYFAEDSAIGKEGRRVRCASCGHSWMVKSAEDGQAAAADTGLTREQVERLRQTAQANSASRSGPHAEYRAKEHARRQRNRSRATLVAWTVGFGLFAATAGASVLFRNQVADAWPRTASLYRIVGLDVNRFGVLLSGVEAKRSFDGTTPVLTVTGMATNPGKSRRPAPLLRVLLRDEHGKDIEDWTADIGVASLAPGEKVAFSKKFTAPPVETYRLTVTFAREDGAADPAAHTVELDETGAHADPTDAEHPPADAHAPDKGYEEPGWSGGDGEGEEPARAAEPAPAATDHGPDHVPAAPALKETDHH